MCANNECKQSDGTEGVELILEMTKKCENKKCLEKDKF